MSIPLSSLPKKYQNQVTGANVACADSLMGIFSLKQKPMIRQKQGDGMNKTERAFLAYLKSSFPQAFIHRVGFLASSERLPVQGRFFGGLQWADWVLGYGVRG